MTTTIGSNSLTLTLAPGEVFYFKGNTLRGFSKFNWQFFPRFPWGSLIARLLDGWYLWMRKVRAETEPVVVPIKGVHPRGNFFPLILQSKEQMYVSAHCVAGFCGSIRNIHTHIHFGFSNWLLRKFFFTVFTGPGLVLIYSRSPIEEISDLELPPERIIAFHAERRFRASAPQPSEAASQAVNIFSGEVLWTFVDGGPTIAEKHSEGDERDEERNFFRRLIEHALAFLRF